VFQQVDQPVGTAVRVAALGPVIGVDDRMVLEVVPDARQVDPDVDTVPGQVGAGTGPGEQQESRGVYRAGREDHLVRARPVGRAILVVDDAGRPVAVERDPASACTRLDGQGCPVEDRLQERVRGAVAPPGLLYHVGKPGAVEVPAVETRAAGQAGFDRGVDERPGQRMGVGLLGDVLWPAGPVGLAGPVLDPLEPLADGVVVPAVVAGRGPPVVIGRVTPKVQLCVYRARAAEGLALPDSQRPVVEFRLGEGPELPVDRRPPQFGRGERYRHLPPVVRASGFEHQ
jgi:hypothetical protein